MSHFKKLALGLGCAAMLSGLALAQNKDQVQPGKETAADQGRPGSGGVNDGPKAEAPSRTVYYAIGGVLVAVIVVFIATRSKKT